MQDPEQPNLLMRLLKSPLAWLAAAVTAVAVFFFSDKGRELFNNVTKLAEKNKNEPSVEVSRDIKQVNDGLLKIKQAAVRLGGNDAERNFTKVFSQFLKDNEELLSDDDKKLLAQKTPVSLEDLSNFEAVRRLGRGWASARGNIPTNPKLLVLDAGILKDHEVVEAELRRAVQNNGLPQLHGRTQLVMKAMNRVRNVEWPFAGLGIDARFSDFGLVLAAHADNQQEAKGKPKEWLPLFSNDEIQAIVARKALTSNSNPSWRWTFANDQDGNEQVLDPSAGIDEVTLGRIREEISDERIAVLSAIDDPEMSELQEPFASEAGHNKARDSVNAIYDAVTDFVDSFSSDWPPPDARNKTSSLSPGHQLQSPPELLGALEQYHQEKSAPLSRDHLTLPPKPQPAPDKGIA